MLNPNQKISNNSTEERTTSGGRSEKEKVNMDETQSDNRIVDNINILNGPPVAAEFELEPKEFNLKVQEKKSSHSSQIFNEKIYLEAENKSN